MSGVAYASRPLIEISHGFNSHGHGEIQGTCASRTRVSMRNCVEVRAVGTKKGDKRKAGRRRLLENEEHSESPNDSGSKNLGMELPVHVRYISSVVNPYIKHLVKLRKSSCYRHSVGSVLVVGSTPLREVSKFLQQKDAEAAVDCLFVQDGVDIPAGLLETSRRIVHVTPLVMQKLAGIESIEATEAIGVIKLPGSFCNMETSGTRSSHFQKGCSLPHRLLVLDGIQVVIVVLEHIPLSTFGIKATWRGVFAICKLEEVHQTLGDDLHSSKDPGNLGTLIRTAVAFQWDGVFLLPGCCDPFNEKALRASQGACFQLPIATGLWSHLEILVNLYQMAMYAGQPDNNKISRETIPWKHAFFCQNENSNSSFQRDLEHKESSRCNGFHPFLLSNEFASATADKPLCLVLGSEGKGLSEQSKRSCNPISIPMPGNFESLNVSVAGGIFLFLLRRQHTTD